MAEIVVTLTVQQIQYQVLIQQLTALTAVSILVIIICATEIIHPFVLAARTTFCRVTQGDCAYQYFVGTTESSNFVVEVMEAGKRSDTVVI